MNDNRQNESDARPGKSKHLNWELLAIWSFVVFSFAAFFCVIYMLWVQYHGD